MQTRRKRNGELNFPSLLAYLQKTNVLKGAAQGDIQKQVNDRLARTLFQLHVPHRRDEDPVKFRVYMGLFRGARLLLMFIVSDGILIYLNWATGDQKAFQGRWGLNENIAGGSRRKERT